MKKLFNSKILKILLFIITIAFSLVLIILFILNFKIIFELIFIFWGWIKEINPNPEFLFIVVSFEIAIIAFLIPLSIEIISKISERYSSDIISSFYSKKWWNIFLPIIISLNIIIIVISKFLMLESNLNNNIWYIFAWIILLFFIFIVITVLIAIFYIIKFMKDEKFVLTKLYKSVKKIIKKSFIKDSNKNKLYQYIEGVGDILVFETKKQKNKFVIEGLNQLNELFEIIFNIKQLNPEKFEKIVISKEFFDLYNKDKNEAAFQKAFLPEKCFIGFDILINQIIKIYETSIEVQNKIVNNSVIDYIHDILMKLSSQEDNKIFIEQILRKIVDITEIEIKNDKIYTSSNIINWYKNIVFNSYFKKYNFQLCYLKLFDSYFFHIIKQIIDADQTDIFKSFIASLIDGIDLYDDNENAIWEYINSILEKDYVLYNKLNKKYNIEQKINVLEKLKNNLFSQKDLDKYLEKFNELQNILQKYFNKNQKKIAMEIEKKIKDYAILKFKYQNLLEIIFATASYCLFKKKYNYIKYLWEYKQPSDSDAIWIANNLNPNTLEDLIKIYFHKSSFERNFNFGEHHGSELYFKKYFLFLFMRIVKDWNNDDITNYKLIDLDISRLNNFKFYIENDFEQLVIEIKKNKNALKELGFDADKIDELFNDIVIPLLNKLENEIEDQIEKKHKENKISQIKVKQFKKEMLHSFYEIAQVRDIFINYFQIYKNKLKNKNQNKQKRICRFFKVFDKAIFFNKWHILFFKIGSQIGMQLGNIYNYELIKSLGKKCETIQKDDFKSVLHKFENLSDIVIFMINSNKIDLPNNQKFKIKYDMNIKMINIDSFYGYYKINNNNKIPVFQIFNSNIKKQILILNKSKIGELIQLSPLNKKENKDSVAGIFYIDIQAFSESKKLMEEFIKTPPEWLKKKGDEHKQREYLLKHVRIQIFERFALKLAEDFEGYKLVFDNNN